LNTTDRVYQFLLEYQRQHKFAPTQSEIRQALGIKSSGSLCPLLDQLQAAGAIERRPCSPRGSYIPTEPNQFA
jgi:SOS-response transcriptional repressor LexA